ncbi:hypothetical protein, partial [Mycoplasmopsis synoviae]|uniref:hypothetical protein n=1 Tax=Mycoplasmopsis synoviae TaxID=2109 RepID=UPI00387AD637
FYYCLCPLLCAGCEVSVCPPCDWAGAAGALNGVIGLTNLVKGILIKKVFNQLLHAIAETAKYTASLSHFICCKNTLFLFKSSKVPGLSYVPLSNLVIVTPFFEFV